MCLEQEQKLRSKNTNPEIKKKKKKNQEHNSRYKKERKKHPHTHFLSYAQTHSKKQHLDLKCNNTNNASLSLFSQKCHPNNSNRSQKPKSNPKATKQNTRSPSISTHLAMVELKQKILGITS